MCSWASNRNFVFPGEQTPPPPHFWSIRQFNSSSGSLSFRLFEMDEDRLKKAIKLAQQATDMDLKGDYEAAFEFYKSSLDHWQLVCKCE